MEMKDLFLIMFLIFAGQTLGCLAGLIKEPPKMFLHGSLAFAASMMLGISFFQLMPEAIKIIPLHLTLASFSLGISMMWIIDKALPHINPELMKKEKPSIKRSVIMLVIGMALHNIPEGLAIGVGFALERDLGIMIAFGIAAQDAPENIATIVPLYGLTKKKMKSFIIVSATVLFELLGFILGYYALNETSLSLLGASLALAAGFMTYISIEELIPAAEIKQNLKVDIVSLISGLICVLLLCFLG